MGAYQNNRDEYRKKCTFYTGFMAIALVFLCFWLRDSMLRDDPSGGAIIQIGLISAIVFAIWQFVEMNQNLDTPDEQADKISKKELVNGWAGKCGISFGGVYAIVMFCGTATNGELGEALPAIIFGCPLFGIILYGISYIPAWLISPEEYLPWRTLTGYQAYLRREEKRRMQQAVRAAQLAARMQSTTYAAPEPSAAPAESSTPTPEVQGRIYRGKFSGPEIGYYTNDTIYKKGDFLTDAKVGRYAGGKIDDDSGIWSAHTVGRYEWNSTCGGYLIYAGDSGRTPVGRVLRNGDIQATKNPNGITEIVLQGTEYTTIGRFSGDPEGAAAAAYLLLFQ